ncbi:MAG TPA: ribbon-helix-helix protein, CopG family [Longimicrobiales bacterium]|nr:ribbon-helix-helix protein, CopG family [Longimicrobiales bacterium]
MKTISLKVPEGLDAHLELLAAERGTSKSELVRQALEAHLESLLGGAGERSFATLAGDLAGCILGPADLSTSPVHAEEFGD